MRTIIRILIHSYMFIARTIVFVKKKYAAVSAHKIKLKEPGYHFEDHKTHKTVH